MRERTSSSSNGVKARSLSPATAIRTKQRQITPTLTPQEGAGYSTIPLLASPTEFYETKPQTTTQEDRTGQKRAATSHPITQEHEEQHRAAR